MKPRNTYLLLLVLLVVAACTSGDHYPQQLIEADSAFMHGNYLRGDSLLAAYDYTANDDNGDASAYRQLLGLEQSFVYGSLTGDHLSQADSLYRYYSHQGDEEKEGKVLCFLGDIFYSCSNMTSAHDNYLRAEEAAQKSNNPYLLGWVYHALGDLYFEQSLYNECIDCYRKMYQISVDCNDTLRMAYGAIRMGRVCTINNEIDSIEYYYQQAITFAESLDYSSNIVLAARHALCDIYIQVEKFEEARALMSRDSLNVVNWAFWHYGQGQMDSAQFYFSQSLDRFGIANDVAYLRYLIDIEDKLNHPAKAFEYYKRRCVEDDTLQSYLKADATRNARTQYGYRLLREERDQNAEIAKYAQTALAVLFILVLFICISWYAHNQKKERELLHEKLLNNEMEERNKWSMKKLSQNEEQLTSLRQLLSDALLRNDTDSAKTRELEIELREAKNRLIRAMQQQQMYMLTKLENSNLYKAIKLHAGEEDFRLSTDDWQQLAKLMDETYDNFTNRLLSLAKFSKTEMRVCYLIKMRIQPITIASILCKSASAISLTRSRMYHKLTGKEGDSHKMDEFIWEF